MTAALRLDPHQGLVRGVRAAVLTVPAVGAAALSHSLADGCGSPLAVAVAAGVCWPAAVALLGCRRRLPVLLLWLVMAQVVTHLLLELMCSDVTSGQTSLAAHPQLGLGSSMLLAHLGGMVVTAVLLARADAGLWAADALLRAGARALGLTVSLPVASGAVLGRISPVRVEVPCLQELWKAGLPARRGPPVRTAV